MTESSYKIHSATQRVPAAQPARLDAEQYIDTRVAAALLCMSEAALRKWRVSGSDLLSKDRCQVGPISGWRHP